jgi:CheY-like chemotaxis protein
MRVNILIVDDIEENRYALQSLLEEYMDNIIIHQAQNGEEALRCVLEKKIDIILLDIQMPVMDGFEVAQLIKKNPKTKDIPIIFLTAVFKEKDFRERGFEVGAVDYLTKPVENYQIINKINVHVDLYNQKKKLKALNANLEDRVNEKVAQLHQRDVLLIQQSKMAAMGEMLGVIAHQWKQPLNILSLVIQNLKLDYELDEFNEESIDIAVENTIKQISYMSNTVDEFLNFFSPNKEKKEFFIKKSIENTLQILDAQVKNHDINISVTGENIILNSYENEFKQILLNIISNSKDILVEKKIENKKITIDLKKDDFKTTILICDNGGGIADDIIDNIFQPYFTTKGDKGTGVGLYMVKMIIEDSMKADIHVNNNNDGACFKIMFTNT